MAPMDEKRRVAIGRTAVTGRAPFGHWSPVVQGSRARGVVRRRLTRRTRWNIQRRHGGEEVVRTREYYYYYYFNGLRKIR